MTRAWLGLVVVALLISSAGCVNHGPAAPAGSTVRVAVIGGMTMTGMWQDVSRTFEARTNCKVEVVKTGPRPGLADVFRAGQADLLTMHSGDITTNLVAEGYGTNMRPWTQNDLVIVGPANDPAGIRGMNDGAEALRKIAIAKANFVDFNGVGSREVCHSLWAKAGIQPRGGWLIQDESDGHLDILSFAARRDAYAVVGRMPVLFEKMKGTGMEIMVDNDPAMRRPYIVMQANPARFPTANAAGARALADFLLSDEVQNYLAKSAANQRDNVPLFHPLKRPSQPSTQP